MKRKEQKENTRLRVLKAAKECIANRDVREVLMQEIAVRAGLSVGALYVHFESRESLIDGIVSELQGCFVAGFKSTLLSVEQPSVPDAIERLALSYVETIDTFRPWVSLYASHVARATSTEALRSSGAAAPLVQMLNATLGSLRVRVEVDLPLLAASLASLWRAAGLSQTARPTADAPAIASSLAALTLALVEKACPELLERDARELARAMAQFIK